MNREPHVCREWRGCTCYLLALEPADDCPTHGFPWPPRCECGRFVKRAALAALEHGEANGMSAWTDDQHTEKRRLENHLDELQTALNARRNRLRCLRKQIASFRGMRELPCSEAPDA